VTKTLVLGAAIILAGSAISAQQQPTRPASPRGTAQAEVGGQWVKGERRDSYQGGKWLEIDYGRPLKRGRNLWGSGADYGTTLNAGAPLWRAGANVSTRLMTETDLMLGDKKVPAGEYSLFIELKSPTEWTLIVSSWGAKKTGNDPTPDTLWGAYNYTPAKDVARVPMTIGTSQVALEQLTWGFADLTATGGKMFLAWDTVNAFVAFAIAK
jgi:hypothetical protein